MPKNVSKEEVIIGDVLHEWSMPEYEKHHRNRAWFAIMSVLGAGFVFYAILTSSFIFALIVMLFGIVLFLQSHQDPIIIPFQITDLGIIINNRFYNYDELEEFYIIYHPPQVKTLFFETKKYSQTRLRIPLMDMDPNEIRATLREYIEENIEKEDEPFSDKFAREWQIH